MRGTLKSWGCDGHILLAGALATLAALGISRSTVADEGKTGEQIFRELCASCHGPGGEGTEEHYPKPLAGNRTLADLAQVIEETMPPEEPERCTGDDARKVAAYIFEAFYSPMAQAKLKPPRIELARLTVRQYRHTVSDLIGSFRSGMEWGAERGLRAEYFKSRKFQRGERVLERVDPIVQFDFGESSPDAEKIDPKEFGMRWQGSLLAPETGDYEFLVRTENGARLWLNDNRQPLIDAWVKSGDQTDHRASLRLLGGRVYPLRLEYAKTKEPRATIQLLWKLPRQAEEIIPARNLSPQNVPESYVAGTPFPPDDRSMGYERGTSISKAWDQATTDAAIEMATYVMAHLDELAGLPGQGNERDAKLREFCQQFAERAFRRSLNDEERQFFVERQFANNPDGSMATKRVLLLVLKSPRFLYPDYDPHSLDSFDIATRISYGLWDSLPDRGLQEAAKTQQLATREQVVAQVRRMLTDLRTRAKLAEFFHQWLKVDQIENLSKDPALYPAFDDAIASDLRTSLDLFIDEVIWSEASDFRQLLLDSGVYLNGRLAPLYGAGLPPEAPFQKIVLETGPRAGVLSHPFLMTGFAYHGTSSPIHRGVFLSRSVLGRFLRPPPEAVAPLAPDLHPHLTTRERVVLQTSPMACQTCHAMINPLGYTLEHFDAIGRYRNEEQGKPIDATGSYLARNGQLVRFTGVRELAEFLASSEETHEAFVEQLFHYIVKQPIRAYGPQTLEKLTKSFAEHQFSIRELVIEILAVSAGTAS